MSTQKTGWRISLNMLFIASALVTVSIANAGPSDGGGGGAYICRDKTGHPTSAELIDLWEGRNRPAIYEAREAYKLNIPYTNESVDAQLTRALDKLKLIDPLLAQSVSSNLEYVRTHIEDLGRGEVIELPPDANLVYGKASCPAEGMMYFDGDTQNLSRKPELFSVLKANSKTNIAAAWMHEALYKSWRDINAVTNDSTEVRKTVACLFATNDCFGLAAASVPFVTDRVSYTCQSQHYHFQLLEEKRTLSRYEPHTALLYLRFIVDRIGSIQYPVPLVGKTFLYSSEDKLTEMNGPKLLYFQNLIGQRFPALKMPYYVDDEQQGRRIATFTKDGDLTQLTMPQHKMFVSGEVIPEHTVKCTRNK